MSKTNLAGLKALQTDLEGIARNELSFSSDYIRGKRTAYTKAAGWLKKEIELIEELEKDG